MSRGGGGGGVGGGLEGIIKLVCEYHIYEQTMAVVLCTYPLYFFTYVCTYAYVYLWDVGMCTYAYVYSSLHSEISLSWTLETTYVPP